VAKLRTVEEFKKMRADILMEIGVRMKTNTTISVGMGTCGIAAGARQTLQAIMAELRQRAIDAHVTITGCIGMCTHEPLVTIAQADGAHITYGPVKPDMVPHLIEAHLVKGRIVQEWAVARLTAETRDQTPIGRADRPCGRKKISL